MLKNGKISISLFGKQVLRKTTTFLFKKQQLIFLDPEFYKAKNSVAKKIFNANENDKTPLILQLLLKNESATVFNCKFKS